MKRRDFLTGTSLATLSAGVQFAPAASEGGNTTFSALTFSPSQWTTIEVVQEHLLPSEPDAPGASDCSATAYLDRSLSDPKFDPDVKGFVLNGIGWLEEIAERQEGQPFGQIQPAKREDLLRQIARSSAGERWLSTLITYSLEALLADPLYGGNPGGIGWKWLGHDPGQPRPTPNKIYGRLGKA